MEENKLAFTQTLHSKYNKKDIIKQLHETVPLLLKYAEQFHASSILYSVEVTKQGNIHYHGIIYFLTKEHMNEYRECYGLVTKDFGFSVIKNICDIQGWMDYIQKDLKNTINKFNVVYCHLYKQQKKCPFELNPLNESFKLKTIYNYVEFKKIKSFIEIYAESQNTSDVNVCSKNLEG